METSCDVSATLLKFEAKLYELCLTVTPHSGLINPRARGGDFVGPAVIVIQTSGACFGIEFLGKVIIR